MCIVLFEDYGFGTGGGSGGHVAIHLSEHYRFDGTVQAFGGDGYNYNMTRGYAAPGTIFRLSSVGKGKNAQIIIDHLNRDVDCKFPIYLPQLSEIAALTLLRRACARVNQVIHVNCY